MLTSDHLIGHRGAARLAPENTLPGIELAARLGLSWIEVDTQLTRDGVLVLMHDDDLTRTTGVAGMVREHDWADLAETDAGVWFSPSFVGTHIPRLDAAISLCRTLGLGMHLEIKTVDEADTDTAEAVADLLRTLSLQEPLIISSFSAASLTVAQRRLPDVPRARAADTLPEDWREISRRLQLQAWHLDAVAIDPAHPPLLREAGLALRAWTVNLRAQAQHLVDWGVEAVFTDDPPALLE